MMTIEDGELADFQTCLLNALYENVSAAEIVAAISGSHAALPFRDYVDAFEPEMLEVAALLVKRWGVRADNPDSPGLQEMPH